MPRTHHGASLELLAPAGSLAIMRELMDSGADAFYVGGKILNMRLHRADLNFSPRDLIEGSQLCHDQGKRFYVTVNKLLGADDLQELGEFLTFLSNEVRPDAILVQDLAVAEMVRCQGLGLAMHASVMMNAHNQAGALALRELGFSRLVLSREASLADARRIRDATGMEIEYFVHGDMCIAHGSQCLYSGVLYGQSGNRGQCMKPCRWPFSARLDGQEYAAGFPLAVRDMNLHGHFPELITNGVSAFKIEGRMRDAAYLRGLIDCYADSLDRYLADPDHYDPGIGADFLEANRKRDFTTAYALGRPGQAILNSRWEGTGKFYSSGKVFSTATAEPVASAEEGAILGQAIRQAIAPGQAGNTIAARPPSARLELAVRLDKLSDARLALAAGADVLILSGEPFDPEAFGSPLGDRLAAISGLEAIRREFPGRTLAMQLPRMMDEADYASWSDHLVACRGLFDELYIGHLGADRFFSTLAPRLVGDSALNVFNAQAARVWLDRGLDLVCLSLELGKANLATMLAAQLPLELTVHGRPTSMYMENDCYENAPQGARQVISAPDAFPDSILRLVDAAGHVHPVLRDLAGRSHLLPTRSLCLIDQVPQLSAAGLRRFRIDGALLSGPNLGRTIAAYRAALDGTPLPTLPEDPVGWSFGALAHD